MSNVLKFNLVIQGPIQSNGRSGKSFSEYNPNNAEDWIVEYNCLENINKILKLYGNIFEEIAIVTWDSEKIEPTDLINQSNVSLHKIKDNNPVFLNSKHPTGQINLLKQFYSFKYGIESFKTEHPIIKLRTDQFIPLNELINYYINNNSSKILVPFFSKNLISDFYFVGTYKQLLNLCSVVLEYGNKPLMNPNLNSVHYIIPASIFLKQNEKQKELQYIMCLKSLLPEINRFGYEINNCKESISINHFIYDHFESLPADVLYSSSWRGEQIVPSKIHSFEYHKIKGKKEQKKLNALNMFIFLSPKKYHTLGIPKTWKVYTSLFMLLILYIFKPLRKFILKKLT